MEFYTSTILLSVVGYSYSGLHKLYCTLSMYVDTQQWLILFTCFTIVYPFQVMK